MGAPAQAALHVGVGTFPCYSGSVALCSGLAPPLPAGYLGQQTSPFLASLFLSPQRAREGRPRGKAWKALSDVFKNHFLTFKALIF